jgi:predicted DNA-binding transcriptional regulator YafY
MACSEVLYEFEGKDVQISKRTIQLDIQLMRSDKLGYNAPIQVYDKKYYCYSDPDFSITDIPLTNMDMEILTESVEMLKQFKEFSLFQELNGVIQKLEDKVYIESKSRQPIIHIDKNENLKGLRHFDKLYQAISKKIVLKITYKSFSADSPVTFDFHGYILKEFNNRWFLVGRRDGLPKIRTLALDRILKAGIELSKEYQEEEFSADQYYANTYGISVLSDKQLIEIEMKIDREDAPYVLTKPFHASQKLIEEYEDGSILVSIKVHHNFEIERLLLGFADSIEVLKPQTLRDSLKRKFQSAYHIYQLDR